MIYYALRQESAKPRIKDANCELAKYAIHFECKNIFLCWGWSM